MINKVKIKVALTGLFFLLTHVMQAQQNPRDTSFTFNSAWQGVKKSHPEASIPKVNVGDSVIATRDIVYCTVNQHQLKLDVFAPNRTGQFPAVLMIFGGGWRSGDRAMHVPMAQKLAARGYVVVTADYRLSTEALYPAAVNDIKTALKWMRANAKFYAIDADRVAVWGFSAGGQLAALVGTTGGSNLYKGDDIYHRYTDKVQAIIDVDGILAFIHPESGEGDDSKKTSAATYWFGSGKTVHPELWQQASALNHVDKNTPPILFLNSGVDRMHAGRNDMTKKLDSLHIYHELHAFEGAPHPFILFEPWFTPSLNYTVAFLDRVLKGKY
jgi:pectinesterase